MKTKIREIERTKTYEFIQCKEDNTVDVIRFLNSKMEDNYLLALRLEENDDGSIDEIMSYRRNGHQEINVTSGDFIVIPKNPRPHLAVITHNEIKVMNKGDFLNFGKVKNEKK